MTPDANLGLTSLAKLGFVDLSGTIPKLDELVKAVGDSGRSAFAPLSESANPDQALNALLELAQSHKNELKKILKNFDSANRLIMTVGASSAMVDFIRRYPTALSVFEKGAEKLVDEKALKRKFVESITDAPLGPEAWAILRRSYRLELLRLVAYDVTLESPSSEIDLVAAGLADLAAAALEGALALARRELIETTEFGHYTQTEVDSTAFAVIAMGKCGARELNYISDVDVIYVAESRSAELPVERALEIATRLATRVMRAMDGNSPEPALWQVDPNLRPEGKSGALVRTLESHLAYYDRWAENWEFQALLKARFIAGDETLGHAYEAKTRPLVWASSKRAGFVDSAQKMRERVLEHIPSAELDRQIKLGPGGLRDIEFTIQLLQLVHGRTDESVQVRDTLSAIAALRDAGYISRQDATSFDTNYRKLRLLEHRIQLSEMRRTHLMPTSEIALRALARSVGRKNAEDLLIDWESTKQEVRSLHLKVFYRPMLSAVARLDDSSLKLSSEQVEERLQAIGFLDPRAALKHIEALTSGLSRRATIQKTLLPVMIQWFGESTEPDAALLAFRRLSEDLGESPWYLKMLRDSAGAASRLASVLSLSKLATSLFERHPEAAAWLDSSEDLQPRSEAEIAGEMLSTLERANSADAAAGALKNIRRRETLRLAMGAVLGELRLSQVEQGLTQLADCYLRCSLKLVTNPNLVDIGELPAEAYFEFGVIAMGRYGGGELGFGSDADLMFVYRSAQDFNQKAIKVAERIVSELRRLTADVVLEFQIDLDLRPEGKNGAIVRSFDSYAQYYERWSDTWESQALLRARPMAGAQELQDDFEELIDRYRYPKQLTQKAIVEIRRIKARVENERLPQGADPRRHLKLGRGSISDVEWLVQLKQLEHGAEHPGLQTPKTLQALSALVEGALIEAHDATVLSEAWTLSSRIRSASVLWSNKRTDVLPNDRRQLEGIARILEYPKHSASALEQDYLAFTRRARQVFERLFYGQQEFVE